MASLYFNKTIEITAPDQILLKSLDNKITNFQDEKGVVTLVSFWATWCDVCKIELPTISKLYEKLKNKGFKVIAVNVGENISSDQVLKFWNDLNLPFEYFLDFGTAQYFDVSALPANFVIDKYDKVALKSYGANDWSHNKYVELINNLLTQ